MNPWYNMTKLCQTVSCGKLRPNPNVEMSHRPRGRAENVINRTSKARKILACIKKTCTDDMSSRYYLCVYRNCIRYGRAMTWVPLTTSNNLLLLLTVQRCNTMSVLSSESSTNSTVGNKLNLLNVYTLSLIVNSTEIVYSARWSRNVCKRHSPTLSVLIWDDISGVKGRHGLYSLSFVSFANSFSNNVSWPRYIHISKHRNWLFSFLKEHWFEKVCRKQSTIAYRLDSS